MSKYIEQISSSMNEKERIRNISIISHVDHGKTTLSDHLLQAGGLISRNMAGSARALDYLDEEQRRGITIKTANISFIHQRDDVQYLINLVDTPGHVDFSGMVSQALRLVDGVIIVVDAVEQVMAQTESVVKQAMNECLKPILYINKIDRLINELKLPQKEIETRLNNIIEMINGLIEQYSSALFKKKWKVGFDKGTVILGSALNGWGISKYSNSVPQFEKIIEYHQRNEIHLLKNDFPIIEAIMGAIVENIPNPKDAQKERMTFITEYADEQSTEAVNKCANEGPLILCVGKLLYDNNRGVISVSRIFSGMVKSGSLLRNRRTREIIRIQQVCIYKGQSLVTIDNVGAGNIAVIIGIKEIRIGDTFTDKTEPFPNILFKQIPYLQESVISRRIEPKRISEIPKLIKILEILSLIKPNFHYSTDENSGEMKIYGVGELQLEIINGEIEEEGVEIVVSDPEVTLAEQIEKDVKIKKTDQLELIQLEINCSPSESKNKNCVYSDYKENCLLVDTILGNETIELLIMGFRNAILKGPIKGYPVRKLTLTIHKLTELSPDSLRYEIIVPFTRNVVHEAIINANVGIYEPIYSFSINTPTHYLGAILNVTQRFGCEIHETEHLASKSIITGKISVESSLQIATELRSASEGYAFWQFEFQGYQRKHK